MKNFYPKEKSKIITYDIVGFDIETYGQKNTFYMGGLYDKEGFKAFYNKKELADVLLSKRYTAKHTIIYATNLAFDFFGVFGNDTRLTNFKFIFRGSELLQAEYKTKTGKVIFRDTFSIAPFGVETLGNIINIPKEKKPVCLGKLPTNDKEKQELEKYNKRDCLVTKKFMEFYQQVINEEFKVNIEITISRQALIIWQTHYLNIPLKHEKTKYKTTEEIYEDLYKAYYGGRTEVFKRGKTKELYSYDVNSLYPFVMLNKFPVPNQVRHIRKPQRKYLNREGVSYAKIYIPEKTKIPFIPKRHNKKLVFPTGRFYGWYSNVELRYAHNLGYNITLKESYIYYDTFTPFKDYVQDIYKKRLQAKKEKSSMEIVFKLLLNSLYGKFASKNITDVQLFNLHTKDGYKKFIAEHDITLFEATKIGYASNDKKCDSNYVFPIFSLYATAYARIHMHKLMLQAKDVYYTDTDSIYTTTPMTESTDLGGVKLEYDVKSAIFIRPKLYMLKGKGKFKNQTIIKVKGLSKAQEQDFKKILKTEKVNKELFVKMRTALKRGFSFNEIIQVEKEFNLEDDKRNWEKHFNPVELQDSTPLHIVEAGQFD